LYNIWVQLLPDSIHSRLGYFIPDLFDVTDGLRYVECVQSVLHALSVLLIDLLSESLKGLLEGRSDTLIYGMQE
jgi:hypothetical protein